ncbi:hypothetical protein M0R89_05740 [Halorussus limi]|uniref:Uncharacterized protein n=1 Tax=Halorussus limi TaxID=2938695 RepID=A0A8U0HZC9_9EURY|nr:hypothetical protein [Halorussus limi]UPV76298.1 hypothetical protein M0R89_05740 [Halorussus limi]
MTAEEKFDEQSAGEESADGDADAERSHLTDVEDGAGCTEIWEHLSERREEESDEE